MKKTTYKKGDFDKLLKSEPFYYINSDIVENNFPVTHAETENPVILRFDKTFTSQEAVDRMQKEGLRGATALELLLYRKNHGSEMKPYEWHIGFGQTFTGSDGDRRVPFVHARADGDFGFDLVRWGGDWSAVIVLVCFCDKTFGSQTLENESTETLGDFDLRISRIEETLKKIREIL